MLTHRGFSAWIAVDGQPLPEYLVAEDANAHRVSCWIPSEEGKAFTVYWQDHGGKVDTCAFIQLDGFTVPGRFLFGSGVTWRAGVRVSSTTEKPFVFKRIDEHQSSTQALGKDQGMITLRIKQVDRVTSQPANPLQQLPNPSPGKRRPGDMCIDFGDEKKAFEQYAYTWSVKPYGAANQPPRNPSTFVSFIFRYRSREFLQAQGIIPDDITLSEQLRAPVRRITSAPAVSQEPLPGFSMATPSPSPPTKSKRKPGVNSTTRAPPYARPGTRKPSETRRTVSCREVPTRPTVFPGEGFMVFDPAPKEDDEKTPVLDFSHGVMENC